ncbi:MAG: HlyD family secretion protein [Planctomycetia bacterium]|nr:HlyD family secretion protein [Planctomycetia bacterium]
MTADAATPRPSPPDRSRPNRRRVAAVAIGIFALVVLVWSGRWVAYRFTHSISKDAFIESHLINVAPQVAGTVVEVFVQEQDLVKKGQLLARIDPSTYEREVELAQARLAVAEAALDKANVDLSLLTEEVPKRITIAEKRLAVSRDTTAQAGENLAMVSRDTSEAVSAAEHDVEAARAAFVLGKEDYDRYSALFEEGSVSQRKYQEATKTYRATEAELRASEAKLGRAEAQRKQVPIAEAALAAAQHSTEETQAAVELAQLGNLEIEVGQKEVDERTRAVAEARRALALAQINLDYTRVTAPYDGVIARKWRHLGDYAHTGDAVFSMYNPDLLYVTVQLEETLLEGVAPGNAADLRVEAYRKPFRGRVVWIGSATSGNFSLIPRDISSGEFTYVVQRVPTRIAIERDERWGLLKPGMSVTAAIEHGPGDPEWARQALEQEARIERLGKPAP